jgi:hypothetical protein
MGAAKKIIADREGSLVTIIALSLPVIILLFMLSLDLNRSQTGHAKLQAASDSASLGTADWLFRARVEQVEKGRDIDFYTWLPPGNEIADYARTMLEQNYLGNSPDSKINYDNFQASAVAGSEYTDVKVKGCADVNQSFVFGNSKKTETVCVNSTARIANSKLSNVEVSLALNSVNMFLNKTETSQYVYLYEALFGGHWGSGGKIGLIPKWFGTSEEMKDNNARISFVPFTTHENIYPYESSFMKVDRSADTAFSLKNMLGRYPVFNDEDFDEMIDSESATKGIKGFKFDSAYDYLRFTPDESGTRGKVFEEIYPALDEDQIYHPSSSPDACDGYWATPEIFNRYYDWMQYSPEYCEPMMVKQFYYDTAKNIVIQPLTDSQETIKKFLAEWVGIQREEGVYGACNQPAQSYLSDLLNASPNDVITKYFTNGSLGMRNHYVAGTGEMHNGLLWAWFALSEKSAGKWSKPSVFEKDSPYYTDRTNLPLPKNQANKQVIMFASGGSTNIEYTSNFTRDYAGCDSYVEFDSNLSHHPLTRIQKGIFDKVGESAVNNYPSYKNSNAASFEKLCDAMKNDGIGINFIGDYGFSDGQWGLTYEYFPDDMRRCTEGGGTYKILDANERYYETLDRIFAKMAAKTLPQIRLVE